LGAWLDALNARMRKYLKRDARNLQIGHAYLMTSPPITSPSEFARILRDDIVPLIEEYCYEDFATLREILGSELVDTERACIRDELFQAQREEDLMQAVTFEELESIVTAQAVTHPGSATVRQSGERSRSARNV
jgi:5-methylcytosine-specific restriction protein B